MESDSCVLFSSGLWKKVKGEGIISSTFKMHGTSPFPIPHLLTPMVLLHHAEVTGSLCSIWLMMIRAEPQLKTPFIASHSAMLSLPITKEQ